MEFIVYDNLLRKKCFSFYSLCLIFNKIPALVAHNFLLSYSKPKTTVKILICQVILVCTNSPLYLNLYLHLIEHKCTDIANVADDSYNTQASVMLDDPILNR